jgi:SAM-dependent methyltransferase
MQNSPVKEIFKKFRNRMLRILGREIDFLYGEEFLQKSEKWRDKPWAEDFCGIIMESFNPASIIDFGCGSGDILAPFEKKGVRVFGVDGSRTNKKHSKINKEDFLVYDLRRKYRSRVEYDLCFCIEVAEHIEEKYSDIFVNNLTRASTTVIFTAAPPGQEGIHHINLKPYEWWIDKFQKHDFKFNRHLTESLKDKMRNFCGITIIYIDNLMIFQKNNFFTKI